MRVQLAFVLVLGICIFFAQGSRRLFLLAAILFVVNLLPIVQLAFPAPVSISGATSDLKVVQLNVNYANKDLSRAVKLIEKLSPDIVCLEEITAFGGAYLSDNLNKYPYRKVVSRHDPFGIAIFSKVPLHELEVFSLGTSKLPAISATVTVESHDMKIVALHVMSPVIGYGFDDRNLAFEQLVQHLNGASGPTAIIGDFNAPSWSFYFKRLCSDGGFRNSERGFGYQVTWPVDPVSLRFPIDNLLCRGPVRVMNRFVCGDVGSDHYPVYFDLAVGAAPK